MVLVKLGSNIGRSSLRKRVLSQQIQYVLLSLKKSVDKVHKPRIVLITAQGGKPYLPV